MEQFHNENLLDETNTRFVTTNANVCPSISAPSTPSIVFVSISSSNNEINVTVVKGPGTATHFTIQMQESSALDVWEYRGPAIMKDEPAGPHYVVNVTLLPGNSYKVIVTSLAATGESGPLNSNEIDIRK